MHRGSFKAVRPQPHAHTPDLDFLPPPLSQVTGIQPRTLSACSTALGRGAPHWGLLDVSRACSQASRLHLLLAPSTCPPRATTAGSSEHHPHPPPSSAMRGCSRPGSLYLPYLPGESFLLLLQVPPSLPLPQGVRSSQPPQPRLPPSQGSCAVTVFLDASPARKSFPPDRDRFSLTEQVPNRHLRERLVTGAET